jgi:beta-glucosidase
LANDKTSPLGSWRIAADDNSARDGKYQIKKPDHLCKRSRCNSRKNGIYWETKINMTDKSEFEAIAAKGADIVVMVLGEHGF